MLSSVEYLEKLVGFPTISRTQNRDLMEYVRDQLVDAGIAAKILFNPTGTNANLFATIGPDDRPGIMLSGHTDVVPVEGQDWTVDPFRMSETDGRLYGRGTTDMKGFVACAVRAAILASSRNLQTPLHLALSYDEEIGCVGVRELLTVLQVAPIKPRFCIVGEPTELAVASGHKGKTALKAEFFGKEVHSALAPMGINALHLAADFLQALRAIQDDLAMSGDRDGDYDVPYTTIHAGVMKGGTALNIVPNKCEIDFEIRNLKSEDAAALVREIEKRATDIASKYPQEARIVVSVANSYPGLDTPVDSEVVSFVKSLTGANSTMKVAFGTEGGLFSERLGVPTVVCGPGSMAQGHKPNEFITRDQMAKCDAMLEALINKLSV